MSGKLRIGLIGCGKWGVNYLSAAHHAGGIVTHVARLNKDLSPHSLSAWENGFAAFKDWRDMIHAPLDAFIVASPPDSHVEICSRLLELGKPVMVEKPMTLKVDDALRLGELSAKSGAPFLVNHVHLFSPAFLGLRGIVMSEGRPLGVRVTSRGGGEGPYRNYSALWDYGPHDLSMCLSLGLGNPTSVRESWAPLTSSDGRHGSHYDLTVGFGKSEANVQVWNAMAPKTRWFQVVAPGMHVVYDDTAPDGGKLRHNGLQVAVSPEKPLTEAVRAFTKAVRTGKVDWRFGADTAVVVARICEAAEVGTVRA